MIIDCISDLHGHYPQLEGGDLLIIGGDWTKSDTEQECFQFFDWIHEQKYTKKIVIAGNHDNLAQIQDYKGPAGVMKDSFTYLCDSGTEFVMYPSLKSMEYGKTYDRPKFKIWGSPWTKTFPGMNPKCKAFTVDTEKELSEKWESIPDNVDILVTHSPVWGIMDLPIGSKTRVGSTALLARLNKGEIAPKIHCFGHIHEKYGELDLNMTIRTSPKMKLKKFKCKFINASHVDERYQPVNKPIRIEL